MVNKSIILKLVLILNFALCPITAASLYTIEVRGALWVQWVIFIEKDPWLQYDVGDKLATLCDGKAECKVKVHEGNFDLKLQYIDLSSHYLYYVYYCVSGGKVLGPYGKYRKNGNYTEGVSDGIPRNKFAELSC